MSADLILNEMLQDIQAKGKMPVLDRLRALWGDEQVTDEERRVDLMFVHSFDEFPENDEDLLIMYIVYTSALSAVIDE